MHIIIIKLFIGVGRLISEIEGEETPFESDTLVMDSYFCYQ